MKFSFCLLGNQFNTATTNRSNNPFQSCFKELLQQGLKFSLMLFADLLQIYTGKNSQYQQMAWNNVDLKSLKI